jgi:hypothetical protein
MWQNLEIYFLRKMRILGHDIPFNTHFSYIKKRMHQKNTAAWYIYLV